ncbi:hypothetical protein EAG18_19995 [Pseudoalteromonas sp. J010]|nr:hypothetical protein EAG18_19995 [Pseudoalteromonas sp. J010]
MQFALWLFIFLNESDLVWLIMPIYLIKWSILRQENLVDSPATASYYRQGTYLLVGKAKILLFALNEKFLTQLASDLIPQIEQVLS